MLGPRRVSSLSESIHQGILVGTAGPAGPGLCLQPQCLGMKRGFSPPRSVVLQWPQPSTSLPPCTHIAALATHSQAQTSDPTLAG